MRKPSQDVAVSGMSGYSAGRRAGGVSGRALVSPVQCDRRAACAATGLAAGHPRAQRSSQGPPLPHPLLAPRQRKRVTSVKQTGGDVVGSRARQPGRRGVHRAGPGHGRCSFPPFIRRRAGPHALRHSAAWRPTQRGAQPGTGGMGQGAQGTHGDRPRLTSTVQKQDVPTPACSPASPVLLQKHMASPPAWPAVRRLRRSWCGGQEWPCVQDGRAVTLPR